MKKILILLLSVISLTAISQINHNELKPFHWKVISGKDQILQHEKEKDLSKNAIKKANEGSTYYANAIEYMRNKDYQLAIEEFKTANKRYKRAIKSEHSWNYIYINMALCYANTDNKAGAIRLIDLVTSKINNEKEWVYNIAIVHYLIGNTSEAAKHLSSIIRMDKNYFQAYVTLAALYENSNNKNSADKVRDRMHTAQAQLEKKNQKEALKENSNKSLSKKKNKKFMILEALKPDVKNLRIVENDDHLQFNKIKNINERNMGEIQEGVEAYENGIESLIKKDYTTAISQLKIAEKKLRRGKISADGLNFTRANLAIAYLSTEEKRNLGQSKRYLNYITKKLFNNRDWAYNIAIACYDYSSRIKGASSKETFLKQSIDLLKVTIKLDRLFLPPYQNLIYIYKESGESKKADKYQKLYEKRRDELVRSFNREEQIKLGLKKEYIFRVNLGTYGPFETPADLFNEEYVITVPIDEENTTYLAGLFYTLDDAISYQKGMKKRGYVTSFIVAFKDGDKITF